jgi:hypothetical protein
MIGRNSRPSAQDPQSSADARARFFLGSHLDENYVDLRFGKQRRSVFVTKAAFEDGGLVGASGLEPLTPTV